MAYSVDGRPMRQSRHIVLKMVSHAFNSGEVYEPSPISTPGTWVLRSPGSGPVVTYGRPSPQPTRIWLNLIPKSKQTPSDAKKSKPTKGAEAPPTLLTLYMVDGTWELEMKNGRAVVACDTNGIVGNLLGRPFTTVVGPLEVADGSPIHPLLAAHRTRQ